MPKVTVFCIITWLLYFSGAPSLEEVKYKLDWMSLQEVEAASLKLKKPILIDLYTDWCGWCKVMDQKTYSDKNVINYLQNKFYPVKVNAETTEKVQWAGKTYHFNPSFGANEFAVFLTAKRLSYPTTVIIPADGSAPQAIPGYLKPGQIEAILKYFGENHYGKTSFDDFFKSFKGSW